MSGLLLLWSLLPAVATTAATVTPAKIRTTGTKRTACRLTAAYGAPAQNRLCILAVQD